MAKINFATLKRGDRTPAERFEFTHQNLPEPMEVWLRPLDDFEEEKASEIADQLSAKYVTGGWVDPSGAWNTAPRDFLVDDKKVVLTRRILYMMARIQVMQSPPNADDKYLVDPDLIYLVATSSDVWSQLIAVATKVSKAGEDRPKAPAE